MAKSQAIFLAQYILCAHIENLTGNFGKKRSLHIGNTQTRGFSLSSSDLDNPKTFLFINKTQRPYSRAFGYESTEIG